MFRVFWGHFPYFSLQFGVANRPMRKENSDFGSCHELLTSSSIYAIPSIPSLAMVNGFIIPSYTHLLGSLGPTPLTVMRDDKVAPDLKRPSAIRVGWEVWRSGMNFFGGFALKFCIKGPFDFFSPNQLFKVQQKFAATVPKSSGPTRFFEVKKLAQKLGFRGRVPLIQTLLSQWTLKKKFELVFSLLNMESPKVQKVSHWLSKKQKTQKTACYLRLAGWIIPCWLMKVGGFLGQKEIQHSVRTIIWTLRKRGVKERTCKQVCFWGNPQK